MAGDSDTVIHAAGASDVEALGRISQGAWEATYRGIVPDPVLDEWIAAAPETWREALARARAESPARRWVGERGGIVSGYATTAPAGDAWLPPLDGAGELTNLYLDPAAIGTGLGRALYDHAVHDLRERGFAPFVVWAFRDNERARRFYLARGLRIDVAQHDWVLGDIPCPIVRFRSDWSGASPRRT
ncbi:MAG: GNAT family N-acetyltransferase [Candidatus Limnocylindria bacterium]